MAVPCYVGDIEALVQRPNEVADRLKTTAGLGKVAKSLGIDLYRGKDSGQLFGYFPVARRTTAQGTPFAAEAYNKIPLVFQSDQHAITAMKYLASEKARTGQVQLVVDEAIASRGMPPVERAFSFADSPGGLRVDAVLHGEEAALPNEVQRFVPSGVRTALAGVLPVRSWLEPLGRHGASLVEMLDRFSKHSAQITGGYQVRWENALSRFGIQGDELTDGLQVLRETGEAGYRQAFGIAPSENLKGASQEFTKIVGEIIDTALNLGIRVPRILDRNTYWPHKFDLLHLEKPELRAQAVERLISSGKAASVEQAELLLTKSGHGASKEKVIDHLVNKYDISIEEAEKRFQHQVNNWRLKSGSLEYERTDWPGYITDAFKAPSIYFNEIGQRLAAAQTLGPYEELARANIRALGKETGSSRLEDMARQTLDLATGRTRVRMDGALGDLYDWQIAKLTYSVFNNILQPANIALKTDVGSLFKGLAESIRFAFKEGDFTLSKKNTPPFLRDIPSVLGTNWMQHAREAGEFTSFLLSDVETLGSRALLAAPGEASLLRRSIKKSTEILSGPFNVVEQFNRNVAIRAGEFYFDKLATQALDPNLSPRQQNLVTSRLKDMGLTIDAVRGANDTDLNAMRGIAALAISEQTQFASNALTRPLFAQSPLGRIVFQFKQFTLGQARLMSESLTAYRRGDWETTAKTAAMLATVYPAMGAGIGLFRSLAQPGSLSGEKITKAMNTGNTLDLLQAYGASLMAIGALGVANDFLLTAASGNAFALHYFLQPPAVSTVLNAAQLASAPLRAAIDQSTRPLEGGLRALGRELGGAGQATTQLLLGDARPVPRNPAFR